MLRLQTRTRRMSCFEHGDQVGCRLGARSHDGEVAGIFSGKRPRGHAADRRRPNGRDRGRVDDGHELPMGGLVEQDRSDV